MHDLQKLNRELRQAEYEDASALFSQIKAAGYPDAKAVAMIYRAGIIFGKMDGSYWRSEYHKLKHSRPVEQASQPEANAGVVVDNVQEEGSITNE